MNPRKQTRNHISRVIATFIIGAALFSVLGVSRAHAFQAQVPIAVDDNYSVVHDQTLTIDAGTGVLANDTIPDPQSNWQAELVSSGGGTLSLNLDGSFTFTPLPGFVGLYSFIYQINDNSAQVADVSGAGAVASATAFIDVTNAIPVVGDDSYSTENDTELDVAAPGVLANDSDPDGDEIEVFDIFADPLHGTVTIHADGSFEYVPAEGFVGTDTFEYEVVDSFQLVPSEVQASGKITKPIGKVTITINETPTPAPTSTPEATSTVVPGEPTQVPPDPTAVAPTPTTDATGGVTDLPNTGAPSSGGAGHQTGLWIVALLLLCTGLVIRRTRRRAS